MKIFSKQILLAALFLFSWFIFSQFNSTVAEPTSNWGYEGKGSPANWGQVAPLCASGLSQSPIDVTRTNSQNLTNISVRYQPSKVKILNNGRTVQINYDSGSYIELYGKRYDVKQFHYHSPSEHSIDGKFFPAELHIVHEKDGNYAVVGILLEEATAENLAYKPFIDNLPLRESSQIDLDITIDAAKLLPTDRTTYRYSGSLTTPPCTEGINWLLMTNPVRLSRSQITALETVFKGNNRPIQPQGIRQVTQDSTP